MRKAQDVHDELRARLHEAAEAHEPDRARILARVERGMSGASERRPRRAARPPVLGWGRIVGATAAVAGALAVGGYWVAAAVQENNPPQQTVAVSPTPVVSPDATSRAPVMPHPSHTSGASKPSGKASASPSDTPSAANSSPAAPKAPAAGNQDGSLWSDGSVDPHSNDFWAQSNVTLKNADKLTSLTVELKIRQTGGVSDTGSWRSAPESDFTTTVTEKDGFLVYTWVLKDGHTLAAGQWVFAGQYNHTRGGRDAKDDRYSADARSADRTLSVAGDFAAASGTDGDS
ncbi:MULTISPECIES: hypothetical protein [Streptomyces]|jgi:hypothetical protein|uniref:Uncharacterized protein n=1 Tax=Streptomyces mirabilis TaxID=68239 RepID=A0ABU3UWN1_9ACTN|nr:MULTISPECIES: hypothetical protein [Streptomyces]MCX4607846.1 hypothetical protein [Streptomyces mirabilis]MCX5348309.1 hypothetical protein [Streptomyces mirabilis]MDU8998331.1 hypothetical protein [Streptomyces mirabilis]QDN86916.1 hypothetical protein FNV61_15940 [Streptomyces sp. RLB3-6]QDN97588.1 hypothetical protein FNV58_17665 [Streptomyces sp. RLB1-9]